MPFPVKFQECHKCPAPAVKDDYCLDCYRDLAYMYGDGDSADYDMDSDPD